MSVESFLGVQHYSSEVNFLEANHVSIDTRLYDEKIQRWIPIGEEIFQSIDIAKSKLNFKKWTYMGLTFLSSTVGMNMVGAGVIDKNTLAVKAALVFLGGLAIRIGITSILMESKKAATQLEAVNEFFS